MPQVLNNAWDYIRQFNILGILYGVPHNGLQKMSIIMHDYMINYSTQEDVHGKKTRNQTPRIVHYFLL